MLKKIFTSALLLLFANVCAQTDRQYWCKKAYEMSKPIVEHLSKGTLRKSMPQEHPSMDEKGFNPLKSHLRYTHLEALGRTMCGIAPWLECTSDKSKERAEILKLSHLAIRNAVDSLSPDYLDFRTPSQPLVDAAFLAQAFLRSPTQLWGGLDAQTKQNVVKEMRHSLKIKPNMSNWLLFTATIETFLCTIDEPYDISKIEFAVTKMEEWYKGDAIYGDGVNLHNDYYNSFVIQPMLVDVTRATNRKCGSNPLFTKERVDKIDKRAGRYAEVLERSISPEGTFPVVGRSILYRTGAMQSLSQAALLGILPSDISPAQVRSALTLVIRRMLDFDGTYDKDGWLTMGFCGNAARKSGETYLSTGSMYLASAVFLPLGLPESDPFWSAPTADWTSKKAWSGQKFPIDGALKD